MKYPRTPHLPWSEGAQLDDIFMVSDLFKGKHVVVTEKMDGENTTMTRDKIHARSLDSRNHPSRNWVKNFWGDIHYRIGHGERIVGENLFAVHSIKYEALESYFLGFSFWIKDVCASWSGTIEKFEELGISPVPVIYKGIYDADLVHHLWNEANSEGYVIRVSSSFTSDEFPQSIGKFVRKDHVQTDEHWMVKPVEKNGLKNGTT